MRPSDVIEIDGEMFHADGLAAAKRARIAGCCIFCEEPLTGRRKTHCGSKDCEAAFYRAWHRDQKVRTPERYGSDFYREKGTQRPAKAVSA